jgi:hypothetical protein
MSGVSRKFRPRTYLGKLRQARREMQTMLDQSQDPGLRRKIGALIEKADQKIAAAEAATPDLGLRKAGA